MEPSWDQSDFSAPIPEGRKALDVALVLIGLGLIAFGLGGAVIFLPPGIGLLAIGIWLWRRTSGWAPPGVIADRLNAKIRDSLGAHASTPDRREEYVHACLRAAAMFQKTADGIPGFQIFGAGGGPYDTEKVFADFTAAGKNPRTRVSVSPVSEDDLLLWLIGLSEEQMEKANALFPVHPIDAPELGVIKKLSLEQAAEAVERIFREVLGFAETYSLSGSLICRKPVWTYRGMH